MKKTVIKLVATPLFVIAAFYLGVVTIQAVNSNNIVPMNDETQVCREACGLGEGKPSGDFFGYDTANECLNNCFAAKGIGGVEGSCSPTVADNCCNAFAAPGQDPDCDTGIEFGQCFDSSSDFTSCTEIGGKFIHDETCSPFLHHTLYNCIDFSFTASDCESRSIGGSVETTNQCGSGQGCFIDVARSGRCLENRCPRFNDDVEYLTVNSTTGDATFKNLRDNRTYSCTLLSSQNGFNCKTVSAGTVVDLIALGIGIDQVCHIQFNIGTDNLPGVGLNECSYRCSIQP